jgi:hypothetical protein
MADLNEGATSFAAANWSDATGFADDATLQVNKPFGPITAGLDQSGLSSTGIDSLDFNEGAVGVVGGGSNGSLQVDSNGGSTHRIRNRGAVTLYLTDGGNGVTDLDLGGQQRTHLTGGTWTDTTVDGGVLMAGASAVLTNLYGFGGGGTIEYNATGFTLARFTAGNWILKRGFTKIEVAGTANVTLWGESGTLTEVEQWGGVVRAVYGNVPTYSLFGGVLDFLGQREALTYGGSNFYRQGGRIVNKKSTTTISNISYPGDYEASQAVESL